MMMELTRGTCVVCQKGFQYLKYRTDKNFCSKSCENRHRYVTKGTFSNRKRRTKQSSEERKQYERQYLQRPEVRERRNFRNRQRYSTEAYRLYSRNRYWNSTGGAHLMEPMAHGYTGHRWFDLVQSYVGNPPAEGSLFFDRWADRMGAAVLALLEGRDIKEAVDKHKREEYPYEYMNRMKDWRDDNAEQYNGSLFGTVPSAEEEAEARNFNAAELPPLLKPRFSNASNTKRFGRSGPHHSRTAPSRRRSFKPYQDKPGNRRG